MVRPHVRAEPPSRLARPLRLLRRLRFSGLPGTGSCSDGQTHERNQQRLTLTEALQIAPRRARAPGGTPGSEQVHINSTSTAKQNRDPARGIPRNPALLVIGALLSSIGASDHLLVQENGTAAAPAATHLTAVAPPR